MILEEATYEAFNYYPSKLKPQSHKPIIAACELCGEIRVTIKYAYRTFCKSCSTSGDKNPFFGKQHLKEIKRLMSVARKGEKNHNWQNGISFEPYCIKFNDTFKEYIREKFSYKCFICDKSTEENSQALSVHHVNYNKDCGCDGDLTCQFVPLCRRCHTKTNFNREYWFKVITDKLDNTIIGRSV